MKFILRYRISDRCLYVSLARNQAPSTLHPPPPPPLTLLRGKASGLYKGQTGKAVGTVIILQCDWNF